MVPRWRGSRNGGNSSFHGLPSTLACVVGQPGPRARHSDFDFPGACAGGLSFKEVSVAHDVGGQALEFVRFPALQVRPRVAAGAARHARESLSPNGSVMLVEPYANDRVEDNLNPIGRLYYSASATLCCAHSLAEEGGLALGAQAGEKKLTKILKEAGFRTVRAAKKTPFNLILEAQA